MANLIDRQKFKAALLAKGIDRDDDWIDEYLDNVSLQNNRANEEKPGPERSGPIALPDWGTPNVSPGTSPGWRPGTAGTRSRRGGYAAMPDAPEARHAAIDFLGNTVWNALDTGTFGALGWLDADDQLEDFFTGEEGPTTFAGRAGAGIGGMAGFLMPGVGPLKAGHAAAKLIGKGVAWSKGTKAVTKNLIKETQALKSANAIPSFKKLTGTEKRNIVEPFMMNYASKAAGFHNIRTKEAFIKNFTKNSRNILHENLEHAGVKLSRSGKMTAKGERALDDINDLVHKSILGSGDKSVMPINTLAEAIQFRLGGGKKAGMLGHAIEEAVVFTAAETPMAVFAQMEQDNAFEHEQILKSIANTDYAGTIGHAVTLGGALGLIRLMPGGKDQPILREAHEKLFGRKTGSYLDGTRQRISYGLMNRKRAFKDFDPTSSVDRKTMGLTVANIYKTAGGKILRDKGLTTLKDDIISGTDDIMRLAETPAGAEKLKKVLSSVEQDWKDTWLKEFTSEAYQDFKGSLPRMVAGSMAFNWGMSLSDDTPLEDKIFAIATGAFMSKKGKTLSYKDASGREVQYQPMGIEKKYTYTDRLKETGQYLELLGIKDGPMKNQLFVGLMNEANMREKYLKPSKTDDTDLLKSLIDKHNLTVENMPDNVKKSRKPALEGHHPIYEHLQLIGDYGLINKSRRMKRVEELTTKQLERFEADLLKNTFKDAENGRIETTNDLDDIIVRSNDKPLAETFNVHRQFVEDIYERFGGKIIERDKGAPMKLRRVLTGPDVNTSRLPEKTFNTYEKFKRSIEILEKAPDNYKVQIIERDSDNLYVNQSQLKDIDRISDVYELKLTELTHGKGNIDTSSKVPLAWGGLKTLMQTQGYYKGLRQTHQKFMDFENSNGVWPKSENMDGHNGNLVFKKLKDIFVDKNDVLYTDLELKRIGKGDEPLLDFAKGVHKFIKNHPQFRNPPLLSAYRKTGSVEPQQLRELKNLMFEGGINGFSFSDPIQVNTFIRDLNNYTINRQTKGFKVNGKPLNSIQRQKIITMKESGLVDQNWQMIKLDDVINPLKAIMPSTEASMNRIRNAKDKVLDMDIEGSYSAEFPQFKVDRMDIKTQELIKAAGVEYGEADLGKFTRHLYKRYKEHVEPFMVDGQGNGVFTTSSLKGKISPSDLASLVGRLDLVDQASLRATHKQFIDKIEDLKTRDNLGKEKQQFLSHLYKRYLTKPSEARNVISLLSDKKLYNQVKNEFTLDTPDFIQKMQDVLKISEYNQPVTFSDKQVKQRILEMHKESGFESDIDLYTSISAGGFSAKYGIEVDQIQGLMANADKLNFAKHIKEQIKVKKGDKELTWEDIKTDQKAVDQLNQDIGKVLINYKASKTSVKRLTAAEGTGVYTNDKHVTNRSKLTEYLDKEVGVGEWADVDLMLHTRSQGFVDSRGDTNAFENTLRPLLYGSSKHLDIKMKQEIGRLPYESTEPHVVIQLGDLGMGKAIPISKMQTIAENFVKNINEAKKTYPVEDYKNVYDALEGAIKEVKFRKVTEDVFDAKGEATGKVKEYRKFQASDANSDGNFAQVMITHNWLSKDLGKLWWDTLNKTVNSSDPMSVAKLARRLRLMSNTSSKKMSKEILTDLIKLNKGSANRDIKEGTKALEEMLKDDGFGVVIYKDEAFADHPTFSVYKESKAQIERELKENPNLKGKQDNILEENGVYSFLFGEAKISADASKADGPTIVPKSFFSGLKILGGAGNIRDIGGIKPVIHQTADGKGMNVIFGKTAFFAHESFEPFFVRNKKVKAVMMDSANKIVSDNVNKYVGGKGDTIDNFLEKRISNDLINKVSIESLSISSIKNSDHPATIPHQIFTELSITESRAAYDWLLNRKVLDFKDRTPGYFNPDNLTNAVAKARSMQANTLESDYASGYDRWIKKNGSPLIEEFKDTFIDAIKTEFIDNGGLLTMNNKLGTQSPISPDMPFADAAKRLRNSTFFTDSDGSRKQYTIGQAEIPTVNKNKLINLDRLNIVRHRIGAADDIISLKKLAKEMGFEKDLSKNLSNKSTLEEAFKYINKIKAPDDTSFEIYANFHRTPSTRPGDIVGMGIKGFVDGVGNQARVNSWDLKNRLEGDFDIDTVNYWWDTPEVLVNKWKNNSGLIEAAVTDAPELKTSLGTTGVDGLDFLKPNTMIKYNQSQARSERMRGKAMQMRRLMHYLKSYSGFTGEKGLLLDLGKDLGKIRLDADLIAKAEKILPDDIQNILDSTTGYNDTRYNESWVDNFLFGDGGRYQGIFRKYSVDGEPLKGHISSTTERAILKEAITPYRGLLSVASGKWDTGKQMSLKYKDMLSQVNSYDYAMKNLGDRAYKRLKNDDMVDLKTLDQIFATKFNDKGQLIKTGRNPFGEWGLNASFKNRPSEGLLPYERVLQTIAVTDKFSIDKPQRLWGTKLANFERMYEKLSNTENKADILNEVKNSINRDAKAMNSMNWFDYKIRSQTDAYYAELKKGNKGLADYIKKNIEDLRSERNSVEQKLVNDPGTIRYMSKVAYSRIERDVTTNHKYNELGRSFPNQAEALKFVKSDAGKKAIKDHIKAKGLIRIKGINSNEALNEIIWNEVLGKFSDVWIAPKMLDGDIKGQLNQQFYDDVSGFKKFWRDSWKSYHNPTFRGESPFLSMGQISNVAFDRMESMYGRWEAETPGLGRLFLWKLMAPTRDVGSMHFIPTGTNKGQLIEAFSRSGTGLRKFAFRWLAQTQRVPELLKDQMFTHLADSHNGYSAAFRGNSSKPTDLPSAVFERQAAENHRRSVAGYEPFIDFNMTTGKFRSIQESPKGINPEIGALFGYNESFDMGYMLNNRSVSPEFVGELKKSMGYDFMPQGYIPMDYTGGLLPSITGWSSYNKAKLGEAKIMLGDALGANILHVPSRPRINSTFETTTTRPKSVESLKQIRREKVRNDEC